MSVPGHVTPIIDPRRCVGCGICVAVCPSQALALRAGRATLVRPEDCTFCPRCEANCPREAIGRPFQISFAPPARRAPGQ